MPVGEGVSKRSYELRRVLAEIIKGRQVFESVPVAFLYEEVGSYRGEGSGSLKDSEIRS